MENLDDINILVDRIYNAFDNYGDYYSWYLLSEEEIKENEAYLTVKAHSTKGDGYDWTEEWIIDSKRNLYIDGELRGSVEEVLELY